MPPSRSWHGEKSLLPVWEIALSDHGRSVGEGRLHIVVTETVSLTLVSKSIRRRQSQTGLGEEHRRRSSFVGMFLEGEEKRITPGLQKGLHGPYRPDYTFLPRDA
jgi:hypothetical protein